MTRISLTDIYNSMVGELPARLQPERGQAVGLSGRKKSQSGIGDVVRLQREVIKSGQHLGDSADRVVGHVDAIAQRQ